jgi:hypothetical protein
MMPVFKKEFSLNALVQLISLAVMLTTGGAMYRSLIAETEQLAMRVTRLEDQQKRSDSDHDLLIEIRQNLLLLRQQVERMATGGRFGAVVPGTTRSAE